MPRHDTKPLRGDTREYRVRAVEVHPRYPTTHIFPVGSAEDGESFAIGLRGAGWSEVVVEWRDVPAWKPLPETGAGQ